MNSEPDDSASSAAPRPAACATDGDERHRLTVRAVAGHGGIIVCSCWRCRRSVEQPAAALVARHGDVTVSAIPLRCVQCAAIGLVGLPYTTIRWPAGAPPGPAAGGVPSSLRGLARAGLSLRVECRACRRRIVRRPHWFSLWIETYGRGADDIGLDALQPRLRCACGARAARLAVGTFNQR